MAINLSISDKTLASKPVLVDAFTAAKSKTGRLHFLGLVSVCVFTRWFIKSCLSQQSNCVCGKITLSSLNSRALRECIA